ncbi:MAG: 2Fe-2S iron-sulfur cluster-binding protein [Bacteroidota bacterium]
MLKITIKNLLRETIEWDEKIPNLLQVLLRHTDIMHACGGKGRCTTCRVKILEGGVGLPEDSGAERRFRSLDRLSFDERLSCQIVPAQDLIIEIPNESKLPHLHYLY